MTKKRESKQSGASRRVRARACVEPGGMSFARARFSASLQQPRRDANQAAGTADAWLFLIVPEGVSDALPSRGQVSVEGTINHAPFQATLQPDGEGGRWLRLDATLCAAAGARAGDAVEVEFSLSQHEPEPDVPDDVRAALAASNAAVRAAWLDITPRARRDFLHWITSPKLPETRVKRIAVACDMLAQGKRRPCCFDRSGMYGKGLSRPVAADEPSDGGDRPRLAAKARRK
jgi:hypothetical protein